MIFFESVMIPVTLLVLLIATYTDLKTREVPDSLNYGLLFAALGLRGIWAVEEGWTFFLSGILGAAAAFLLASVLYYTRQWGGGDAKLLLALGAVLGISYPFTISSLTLLWFLVAVLAAGALYGLIWIMVMAWHRKKEVLPHFKTMVHRFRTTHIITGFLSLLFLIITFFVHFLWPLLFLPLGFFYLFLLVQSVEKECFYRRRAAHHLTEGDWLAEDIVVEGKTVLTKKTLEKEDLEKVRTLEKERKISSVLIKEGIPFVPSFLIGYLLLLIGVERVSAFLAL